MFKPLRREKNKMSDLDAHRLLDLGEYGVLAVLNVDGYPYAVPVNYVSEGVKLWVHCAQEGAKIEAIIAHPAVSFTVVGRHAVDAKRFSSDYESVICFGQAQVMDDSALKIEVLQRFIKKYAPANIENGFNYVNNDYMKTAVIEIVIEHISGKTNIKG